VGSPRDAFDIALHVIGADIAECLISIFLDSRRRVTGYAEIARGTFNVARFAPRDVLVPALLTGCSAFVLAHNHPSQDAHPSPVDRSMTAALRSACAMVGLDLLDHLIVTRDRYFSFRECEDWK
jgi:DNA repair protein RadC